MEKILIIERNILNPECCSFLKQKGYDVTKIDFSDAAKFNERSFVNKYLNIFLRVVFRYKNYLYKAERKFNKKERSKLINRFCKKNTEKFDKVIVIRPDYLSQKSIHNLAKISTEMVGYFWDSISPGEALEVSKSAHLFKNLLIYDKIDLERYAFLNLKFITNFYYPIEQDLPKSEPKKLYYLGNITIERRDFILEKIISKISDKEQYQWNILFNNFPVRDYELLSNEHIQYITKSKDYIYHLEEMMRAYTVFDINPSYNNGLSFRFFEALYYETKIITTNKNVLEYDFYNTNNVFVYNNDTTSEEINAFLKLPFVKMNDSVIEKYRVDNWIKKIFS